MPGDGTLDGNPGDRGKEGRPLRKPPLRDQVTGNRVTKIELFFDLVYIFAITQLSHHLLVQPTLTGALQTTLLWVLVWLLWAYTTWLTNWLDPERFQVRVLLIILMLVSLIMSVALPRAFSGKGLFTAGLVVAITYAVHQVGRAVFAVAMVRGPDVNPEQAGLRWNFKRILAWCVLSGALAIGGGLVHGWARGVLWVLAAGAEVAGGLVGYPLPQMGRSLIPDDTIRGAHFAERWQAFILIALGESIIITGTTMSRMAHVAGPAIAAFVVAFSESVAFWWLYFRRSGRAGAVAIATSDNPGALARTAYHRIHWFMVLGIIVTAAGDEQILTFPSSPPSAESMWMILGGPALYVAGHAAFKYAVWRDISWPHVAGLVTLALLVLTRGVLPDTALTACATAVIAAVAAFEIRAGSGYPASAGGPSGRQD